MHGADNASDLVSDLASDSAPDLASDLASDLAMMRRCVALAGSSARQGEYPFAAVIARNGDFVCESINRVKQDRDVNHHAELVAISKAQLVRGSDLSDCTIYTTVEPCALCSYAIREARIGKVVYGLRSPLMGGHSRWNILSDTNLSRVLPEVFRPAPQILSGFMQEEVEAVFRRWKPFVWHFIKARGVFVGASAQNDAPLASKPNSFIARLMTSIRTLMIDRIGRA
jgi:tRNA(adenine34) deaminase